MADAQEVRWVATLSDGSTAVEHSGEFQVVPGKRTPWWRLTELLGERGLHLTSLRLNFQGRTIHMPRANFDRFDLNNVSVAPLFYSLCYHAEGEIDQITGHFEQTKFVELSAHYPEFDVSYIQDITNGNNSWIVVTQGRNPMAPTPPKQSHQEYN